MASSSTPLPGEHGFHMRDGSLLKKKREQWEREREEGKRQWFPFGSRSSPRKNKSITPTNNDNNNSSPVANDNAFYANPSPQMICALTTATNNNNSHPEAVTPFNWPQYMAAYPNQPQLYSGLSPPLATVNLPNNVYLANPKSQYPMQMYTSPGQLNNHPAYFPPINFQQQSLNGNYNPPYLDPNFTQNPHFNGLTERMEIVETRYEPVQRSGHGHLGQLPCPSNYASTLASVSIANGDESSAFTTFDHQLDGKPNCNRRHTQLCQDNEGLTGDARDHSKSLTEQEINEQIAERQRIDALNEERERLEIIRVEKDHMEQVTKQQQEADEENSKWKKRQQKLEAIEKATLLPLEKAKKEAEVLRKAKLYKHILLAEGTTRTDIQKVLSIDDPELSDQVIKQLKAFDRQKRIDMDKLNTSVGTSFCASNQTLSPSRENTSSVGQANSSPVFKKLERRNTSNSIKSPLARKPEATTKQSNNSSPSDSQTMTPLRRDNVGRGSLRIPMSLAKKSSPADSSPAMRSSIAASNSIRQRSESMERLNNKPVFKAFAKEVSKQNNDNYSYSPVNAKKPSLKDSASNISPKPTNSPEKGKKNLPHPVPPPRRHNPTNQSMARNGGEGDQEAENKHWSRSYIISQTSHIPIPPPRSNHQEHYQRGYDHTLQLLSDLPDVGQSPIKSSLLRRTDFGLKPAIGLSTLDIRAPIGTDSLCSYSESALIAKFEPVCTRSRQSKTMTQMQKNRLEGSQNLHSSSASHQREQNSAGASSVATESESPESSSPISSPPPSSGFKSRSPYENNPQLTNEDSLSADITNNHHKCSEVERIMINQNKSAMHSLDNCPSNMKSILITQSNFKDSMSEGINSLKPPRASPFARRLAESGALGEKMSAGEHLAPEMLRRNLRSPTMMRLQESLGNLNVAAAAENESSESLSRPMTPSKPFNCRITQNYRSLNLKKDTERQHRILEQLAKVRAQLKDRQEKIERTFSNQNLANTT